MAWPTAVCHFLLQQRAVAQQVARAVADVRLLGQPEQLITFGLPFHALDGRANPLNNGFQVWRRNACAGSSRRNRAAVLMAQDHKKL